MLYLKRFWTLELCALDRTLLLYLACSGAIHEEVELMINTLCQVIEVSYPTLILSINRLEKLGLIKVNRYGGRHVNEYRVLVGILGKSTEGVGDGRGRVD